MSNVLKIPIMLDIWCTVFDFLWAEGDIFQECVSLKADFQWLHLLSSHNVSRYWLFHKWSRMISFLHKNEENFPHLINYKNYNKILAKILIMNRKMDYSEL